MFQAQPRHLRLHYGVHAPGLAPPTRVARLVRAAHRGDELHHLRALLGVFGELFVVAELILIARALKHIEPVAAALAPVQVIADVAHIRHHARHRGDQHMVLEIRIESKDALGARAYRNLVPLLQFIEQRRQVAALFIRHKLNEKLKVVFVRRGRYGICALYAARAYRAVLARLECEPVRLFKPHQPQIARKLFSAEHFDLGKLGGDAARSGSCQFGNGLRVVAYLS